MTTSSNPPQFQFQAISDQTGEPLAFGLLYTYISGTNTPQATFTDQTGTVQATNPVVLSVDGKATLWLNPAENYRFDLWDATNLYHQQGYPIDNVVASDGSETLGILTQLANTTSASEGQGLVGFNPALSYPANTLPNALASPTGATLIGTEQSGTGAVARTVQQKLSDVVSVLDYGADPTGATDSTAALQGWATCGNKNKALPAGTFKISSTITFEEGSNVQGQGQDSIIDASAAGASFNGGAAGSPVLAAAPGVLTTLPALASTNSPGDTLISFVAAHNLTEGQVFCIYNPTAGSFGTSPNNGHSYNAGEWCRVAKINSPTQVTVWDPLYCSGATPTYTASNVVLYALSQASIRMNSFRVKAPQANLNPGLLVSLNTGVRIEDLQVDNNDMSGISLWQCYDFFIRGAAIRTEVITTAGYQYGIVLASCQKGTVQAITDTVCHGITISELVGVAGGVPSRAITIHDSICTSNYLSGNGVGSIDCHGGSEDILFDSCQVFGGINVGGANVHYRGCKIFVGNSSANDSGSAYGGACAMADEIMFGAFTFEHCDFITLGNPSASSHGIIDFGGNGGPLISAISGPIDIHVRNCTLRCPNAVAGTSFVWVATRGSVYPVNVLVDGLILLGSGNVINRVTRYEVDNASTFTGSINASLQLVLGSVPVGAGNSTFTSGQGLTGSGIPPGVTIGAYLSGGTGPGTVGAIYALTAPSNATIVPVSSEAMSSTGNPNAQYLVVDNIIGSWPVATQLMAYANAPTTNPMRMQRQTQRQTIISTAAAVDNGGTWFFNFQYPKQPTMQVSASGAGNAVMGAIGQVTVADMYQGDVNYCIPRIKSAGGGNFATGISVDLHSYVEINDF